MALIEIYHVVASYYPVSTDTFVAGTFAMLTAAADGSALASVATGGAGTRTIGVFGDSKETSGTPIGTPFGANVIVNAQGDTVATQNRVSDMYNETLASGKVTVYHSGGEFQTDQFQANRVANIDVGMPLYVNSVGALTDIASANAQIVATCINPPAAYPSGVPGTDVQGSMSLGTYLRFKLEI
jgi:hypothetical protein